MNKNTSNRITNIQILEQIPIHVISFGIAIIVMAFAAAKYVFRKIYTVIADLSNLINSSDNNLINAYGHKCPVNLRYWPHGYNYMFMDVYDRFLDSFEGSDERLRVYWSKEKPKCIKSEIKSHWEFNETPTIIAGNVFPMDMFSAPIHELIWEIQ